MKDFRDFLPEPKSLVLPLKKSVEFSNAEIAKWLIDVAREHKVTVEILIEEIVRAACVNDKEANNGGK